MLQRRLFCSLIAGAITLTLLLTLILHSPANAFQQLHTSLASRSAQQHAIQAATGGDPFIVPSRPASSTPPFIDFPPLIWQTGSDHSITQYHNQTLTWTQLNPNHTHTILTDATADAFVHTHFSHRPSLIHLWTTLSTPVLRADLLRYLLLLSQGGVYSDIDTTCLVPITQWIPPQYRMHAAAVVGIEYDDTTYSMFVRPVSFNQWTLMAKPGHPIFVKAVERVQSNLELLARQKRTKSGVAELKLEMVETLEATGPGMISDVVLEVLRDQMGREGKGKTGEVIDWKTFQGLRESTPFRDVLVLPINGFAGHQKHSHTRFGEKPYLIYTSWLLNRRFGIRKRKGQSHFGHSISRSIMRESITSFPCPELRSACKRFRGEAGFQLYSWYVTFHYLIERHREALLWSYLVLRSDDDGDGMLSYSERQTIIDDLNRGTKNLDKSSFRRRNFYHVGAALKKAGPAPPQVNIKIQWTSLDGPASMHEAGDCADFNIDDCLGPGFGVSRSSAGNPLFSAAVIFDRTSRQNPHCGDCLLKIVLHQVRQGLSPLVPHAETQPRQRELVVKALNRYKYSIVDRGNSLFVMVTDADQVDSTLVRRFVREGKELPGQLCLNDDVSTTDPGELDDTREAITEFLKGMFPEKAAWEK